MKDLGPIKWLMVICLLVLTILLISLAWVISLKSGSQNPPNSKITFSEILTTNRERDALVFTGVSEHAVATSTRYRIEFIATRDSRPFMPFQYYRTKGLIVTEPGAAVCRYEYQPLVQVEYIEGKPLGGRSGLRPDYDHDEKGNMFVSLLRQEIVVCNPEYQKGIRSMELVSINSNNQSSSQYSSITFDNAMDYMVEYWSYLRPVGLLFSHDARSIKEWKGVETDQGIEFDVRFNRPSNYYEHARIVCDPEWKTLVRSVEFFRPGRKEAVVFIQTQGMVRVGELMLARTGRRITKHGHLRSDWQVEIENIEALPPLSYFEWPEYLEAKKIIDEAKTKEQEPINIKLEIE